MQCYRNHDYYNILHFLFQATTQPSFKPIPYKFHDGQLWSSIVSVNDILALYVISTQLWITLLLFCSDMSLICNNRRFNTATSNCFTTIVYSQLMSPLQRVEKTESNLYRHINCRGWTHLSYSTYIYVPFLST